MFERENYLKSMEIYKKEVKSDDLKILIEMDYECKRITKELYEEAIEFIYSEEKNNEFKNRIKIDQNVQESKDKTSTEEYLKVVMQMYAHTSKDKIKNFVIKDYKNGRITETTCNEALELLNDGEKKEDKEENEKD